MINENDPQKNALKIIFLTVAKTCDIKKFWVK